MNRGWDERALFSFSRRETLPSLEAFLVFASCFRLAMEMTFCQECGKPWGVILARGEMPTPESIALCRAELVEEWLEGAECEVDEGTRFDFTKLPPVKAVEVVYLTESLARFCDENGICDPCFEADCWQELEWVELPGWLLKGRKRRWAVRWDCCNIGHADNYVVLASLGYEVPAL